MRPSAVPLALTFEGPLVAERDRATPSGARNSLKKLRSSDSASEPGEARRTALDEALDAAVVVADRVVSARRIAGIGDSWLHYFALDVFDVLNETFDEVFRPEGTGLLALQADPAQQLALDGGCRNAPPAPFVLPQSSFRRAATSHQVESGRASQLDEAIGRGARCRGLDIDKATKHIAEMRDALVELIEQLKHLCKLRLGRYVPIILHGYAYPHPDGRGPLGTVKALGKGRRRGSAPSSSRRAMRRTTLAIRNSPPP